MLLSAAFCCSCLLLLPCEVVHSRTALRPQSSNPGQVLPAESRSMRIDPSHSQSKQASKRETTVPARVEADSCGRQPAAPSSSCRPSTMKKNLVVETPRCLVARTPNQNSNGSGTSWHESKLPQDVRRADTQDSKQVGTYRKQRGPRFRRGDGSAAHESTVRQKKKKKRAGSKPEPQGARAV